jgi:hypothetical protein
MVWVQKSRHRIRTQATAVCIALPVLALIVTSLAVAGTTQNGAARPQPTAASAGAGSDTATAIIALIREFVIACWRLFYLVTSAIWDIALWISERMIGFLGNSIVNPVSGDRLLFGGVPGVAFEWAAPVLAMTLLGALGVLLVGPLYMSWKMWRARHNHRLHYR